MDKRDEVDDEYDEVIGLSQIQLNDDVDKRSRARRNVKKRYMQWVLMINKAPIVGARVR